jgi:Mg-chelatase subunit ChlI
VTNVITWHVFAVLCEFDGKAAIGGFVLTRHVTFNYKLPDPFFVLATQNPVEQEGTYPLPEAQLDRFMFMVAVDYPSAAEERLIMKMGTGVGGEKPSAVLGAEDILSLQQTVRRMPSNSHSTANTCQVMTFVTLTGKFWAALIATTSNNTSRKPITSHIFCSTAANP